MLLRYCCLEAFTGDGAHTYTHIRRQGFPDGSEVKNLPDMQETTCNAGDAGSILGSRRSLGEKEMATHSSILVWKIPRTEEPDGP